MSSDLPSETQTQFADTKFADKNPVQNSLDLTAHFLIAMPYMEDENFSKTVVYLCEHSERGALGIVINKPTELTLPKLFAKVDLPLPRSDLQQTLVFGGGPLHMERGFVLHERQEVQLVGESLLSEPLVCVSEPGHDEASQPPKSIEEQLLAALKAEFEAQMKSPAPASVPDASFYASTLCIPDGLDLTTSKDVLDALASGGGPRRLLVSLGASGWAKGQLESELAENTWLTVKASSEIIFDTPVAERYSRALGLLGLQEWMITPEGGRA